VKTPVDSVKVYVHGGSGLTLAQQMIKKYKNTINEATECSFRVSELAGIVAKQKRVGFYWSPAIFGILYFVIRGTQQSRLLISAVFSVLYLMLYLATYKGDIQRRIRQMIIKSQGTADPVDCEYEIDSEGLVFRKLGQELKFAWSTVKEVIEKPDSIEIIMEPTAIAIIPTRIFENSEEKNQWVDYIEKQRANQNVEPIVTTPVESGSAQSSQAHV